MTQKQTVYIGCLTANRPEMFKKAIVSIIAEAELCSDTYNVVVVVVNNSTTKNIYLEPTTRLHEIKRYPYFHAIHTNENLNIAQGKNILIRDFMRHPTKAKYLFIVEDDVILKPGCIKQYIETHKRTGIHHLLCGSLGPTFFEKDTQDVRKLCPVYDIHYYKACVGVFNFFSRAIVSSIGLMDERFRNAMEHVEYSYRAIRLGYIKNEMEWPDIKNSEEYIIDQDATGSGSIRSKTQQEVDTAYSLKLFEHCFAAPIDSWNWEF